jgi:SSS family solute:Na+ symporter
MWEKGLVVGAYFVVLLGIGFFARRRAHRTTEDYFVASRTLPGWVLFFTMAATNFSAFTVFGFSGAGWRLGYSFYPIMAFGTGFMALSFYFIGRPVWRLGKARGLLTPPELVFDRFGSPTLRLLFLGVWCRVDRRVPRRDDTASIAHCLRSDHCLFWRSVRGKFNRSQ